MTGSTEPAGPTGQISKWIADLNLDDIPAPVITRAKHLLLDGVGCALIGAQLPWSRVAVEAVLRFEDAGKAPLIGWGSTCGTSAAALLNSSFIQGFELDDFHPLAPLHSTSLIIPAVLATLSVNPEVDGARVLTAAIAGFEVGPRVGLALHGSQMLSRGWHSGPVFGTLASAASVGSLIGLDAGAMEDALGMAATQSGGLMAAQFGAMSKRMQHGFAARNGLHAALLARGGYTGIKQVFEQPYGGFLSTFGEGHDPDETQITEGLGIRWETERIVVKPYAAMGGLHAALDALFEIDGQRHLIADEIERIDVYLSHAVFHHGWWPPERPLTPTGAQMNTAYVVAVGVLDGAALIDQFSPARIDADDVWALIPRIEAHHDSEFDALGALGRGRTRLRVQFTDGSVLESSQVAAKSAIEPLANDAIVDKYRQLTASVLDADRQTRIEHLILSLDQLDGLGVLIAELALPVGSPFEASTGR